MVGKLRAAVVGRDVVDEFEEEEMPVTGASLDETEFEVNTVETQNDQQVKIFVSKPSVPAYFDENEEYAPTIVGTVRQDEVEAPAAEPVTRQKHAVSEPADIFINALRRPMNQRFDTSVPYFKKKAEAEPVTNIEKAPVETVKADVEDVVSITDGAVPSITVSEVEVSEPVIEVAVPAVEEAVVEAPVSVETTVEESFIETLEFDESKVECEIAHEAVEEAMNEIEEIQPAVEVTPVLALAPAAVLPALPQKIEIPELVRDEENVASVISNDFEVAETSAEAVAAPTVCSIGAVCVAPVEALEILDESEALLAFRPELSDDGVEFVSTSFDDNSSFREDYLDETERTFKIRRSSIIPEYKFDGNLRSVCRF